MEYTLSIYDQAHVLGFGGQFHVDNLFALRGGYRIGGELGSLSAGIGIQWRFFIMDYAFVPFSILGIAHRLTVTLRPWSPDPSPEALPPDSPEPKRDPEPDKIIIALEADPQLVLPNGSVDIIPTAEVGLDSQWNISIFDSSGAKVQTYKGLGHPPKKVIWHGSLQIHDLKKVIYWKESHLWVVVTLCCSLC